MPVKNQEISNGETGDAVGLNTAILKSVQVVHENSFDGQADVEVSNNGSDWDTYTTDLQGLAEMKLSAQYARINCSGTQGNVTAHWSYHQ